MDGVGLAVAVGGAVGVSVGVVVGSGVAVAVGNPVSPVVGLGSSEGVVVMVASGPDVALAIMVGVMAMGVAVAGWEVVVGAPNVGGTNGVSVAGSCGLTVG